MPDETPKPVRPASRRRKVVRALIAVSVLAAMTAGLSGWWAYEKLDGNIRTDDTTEKLLAPQTADRPRKVDSALNILVMGSDYRPELGSARSDTVFLLHLSADGKRAEVTSVPRDLMVRIPRCQSADGGASRAMFAQFNWSFQFGGAACTIRTFESLTGIPVDHHLVLGLDGFKKIVDEVGGVEMTLPRAERDPNVGLDLPAGRQVLHGTDALAYVRARSYVGDGSDINRMARQQRFMSRLSDKVRADGSLLRPGRFYRMLDAITASVTASPGLDSLGELYGLVKRFRAVPEERVRYGTVPQRPYPADSYRVVLRQPAASELFDRLRTDRP